MTRLATIPAILGILVGSMAAGLAGCGSNKVAIGLQDVDAAAGRDAPAGGSAGGTTDADNLYFGCPPDHAGVTDGHYTTTVTDEGRIAWEDGNRPPAVNRVHRPGELLDDEESD